MISELILIRCKQPDECTLVETVLFDDVNKVRLFKKPKGDNVLLFVEFSILGIVWRWTQIAEIRSDSRNVYIEFIPLSIDAVIKWIKFALIGENEFGQEFISQATRWGNNFIAPFGSNTIELFEQRQMTKIQNKMDFVDDVASDGGVDIWLGDTRLSLDDDNTPSPYGDLPSAFKNWSEDDDE